MINSRTMKYEDDPAFKEWLESIKTANYQSNAETSFNLFIDFLKNVEQWEDATATSILNRHYENRKSDDIKQKYEIDDIISNKFYNHLLSKGNLSKNSVITNIQRIRGFFKYNRAQLELRGRLPKIKEVRKKWHGFTHEDLRNMIRVSDVEERAVLELGINLGIRVGDFKQLKRKPILHAYEDQRGEFPLEFQIETAKQDVLAIGHITEECYGTLNDYWNSLKTKSTDLYNSEYVFPSKSGNKPISDDRINDVVKNTFYRAFPDRDRSVRFHELRSYKISVLSNAQINQWHIKRMTGKTISKEDFEKPMKV